MPLTGFDDLSARADARNAPATVAVAGADDPSVLTAVRRAFDRGWIVPILFGPAQGIAASAASAGVALEGLRLVDPGGAADAIAAAAVDQVRSGAAALLMKGQIATPALMRAVLHPDHGLRTPHTTIGQVVLMEIVRDRRAFLLTDTGVTIRPTLDQKSDLLRFAAAIARALGAPMPRVAIMAATESVNPALPDTLDAAELQARGDRGAFGDCIVRGPLSFDLAYDPDAGSTKHVAGDVVGAAEVMVFPDLVSANLTVKAIMYTADCRFGGVLVGTTAPVVFMSRADRPETRLRSLALALRVLDAGPIPAV